MAFLAPSTLSNITGNKTTKASTSSSISSSLSGTSLSNLTGAKSTNTVNMSAITGVDNTQVASAKAMANDIISKNTSSVTSALSGITNTVQSTIGSLASSVSKSVSGIFGKSVDSSAATMNKTTPDPLKTSTVNGTPQAKTFTLNNQYAQTTAINLQSVSPAVSDATSSLSTIGTRIGAAATTTKANLLNMTNSITKSGAVNSLYKTVDSAKSSIASTVSSVTNSVGSVESSASSVVSDFTDSYSSFFQNLAGASSGSSITDLVDTSLPATTDADGNVIEGVPSNVSASKLMTMYGTAKDIGCSVKNIDFTKFGALQSFKSAFLEIASQLNMTNLLSQITNCEQFQDANSLNTMTHMFYDNADSNVAVANIAANGVNDASRTSVSTSLAKSMVTSSSLTSRNVSDVSSIFKKMNVKSSDVYGLNTGGSTYVYDSDTVSASPSYLTSSLLNDNNISNVLNGTIYSSVV